MTDRPIIMSTESVKAILDSKKTMSRRVIRPQPYEYAGRWVWAFRKGKLATGGYWLDHCPYGQVGDRLWVRETWATEQRLDYLSPSRIGEAGDVPIWWKASSSWEMASISLNRGKWRPSIFMPRWASRITLEITDIRVERVQEISEEDAKAEGCVVMAGDSSRYDFMILWDSLNAKRGFGWEVNPWVWVISFKEKQKDE